MTGGGEHGVRRTRFKCAGSDQLSDFARRQLLGEGWTIGAVGGEPNVDMGRTQHVGARIAGGGFQTFVVPRGVGLFVVGGSDWDEFGQRR